jgi:hypothetical protein
MKFVFRVLYSLVAVWTLWPIGSVLLADGIAAALHCRLSEGGPIPCSAFGVDISRQPYVSALAFWYALTTLPTGVGLLLAVAVSHGCVHALRTYRRKVVRGRCSVPTGDDGTGGSPAQNKQ